MKMIGNLNTGGWPKETGGIKKNFPQPPGIPSEPLIFPGPEETFIPSGTPFKDLPFTEIPDMPAILGQDLTDLGKVCQTYRPAIEKNHTSAVSSGMGGTGAIGWVIMDGGVAKEVVLDAGQQIRPAGIETLLGKYGEITDRNHALSIVQTGTGPLGSLAIQGMPWE
ncbi:MAG TPA: hypothetical protein PL110_10480 [Candidatus Eremiobacteraeota bacterium]|nr:MAG: hypothetical protein BWY64_02435 [bacterium ADurb.Bin363]HPZ08529.1 hypothetical protein [Candidatus Eremiobacteraeota bacterium]